MSKRILRFDDVVAATGLSRTTIYNRLNPKHVTHDPSFPKPVPLGPRLIGWSEEEVYRWVDRILSESGGAR